MTTSTQSKVALVTGAASGIGLAVAQVLAAEGWTLSLADMDSERLDEATGDISPQRVLRQGCDVSDSQSVQDAVGTTIETLGRLDALVNCAGISHPRDQRIEDTSEEDFDRTIAVNLRGTFLTCKYAIPHLVQSEGVIVNFASIAAIQGGSSTAYPASKGGVAALTRSIAQQNAEHGVRANAVLPGFIATPMLEVSKSKAGSNVHFRPGMFPRVAGAEEVAFLVAFLVSDKAQYITGASYTIDGGLTQH